MSPVTRTGSPLQKRTIVLGASGFLCLYFTVQMGSSMFFFYRSLGRRGSTKAKHGRPCRPRQRQWLHWRSTRCRSPRHRCRGFGMSLEAYLCASSTACSSSLQSRSGKCRRGRGSPSPCRWDHCDPSKFTGSVGWSSWNNDKSPPIR